MSQPTPLNESPEGTGTTLTELNLGAEVKIRRTLFSVLLILFATVIAVVFLLGYLNQQSIIQSSREQQRTLAEFAGRNIELGLSTGEMGAVKQTLDRLETYSIFAGAVIFDAEETELLVLPEGFILPPVVRLAATAEPVTQGNIAYEVRVLKDKEDAVNGYLAIAFDVSPVITSSRWALALACGIGLLVLTPVMAFAAWRTKTMLRPVGLLEIVLQSVAAGDLTNPLQVQSRGVVGRIAAAFNQVIFTDLRGSFRAIAQNADRLVGSSGDLTTVSERMASTADQTSAQAAHVTDASRQVSENVQTVAAAVEQMGASVNEISKNVSEATRIANQAVKVAETTNTNVANLGESSVEIGKVVEVISDIAEQTNMLALNATIEAARAGESGRGFAVVANEVKELARETASATESIRQRIAAIQEDTAAAVSAIGEIRKIINQINETQSLIASAIEEQTSTNSEITRNVAEAARRATEIVEHITSVANAASDTSSAAAETQDSAREIAQVAEELRNLVGKFKY